MEDNNQLSLVSLSQAKLLKEIGFSWPVRTGYIDNDSKEGAEVVSSYFNGDVSDMEGVYSKWTLFPAPPISLALKWLREKRGIDTSINSRYVKVTDTFCESKRKACKGYSWKAWIDGEEKKSNRLRDTYEGAQLDALDKILETIKAGKNAERTNA